MSVGRSKDFRRVRVQALLAIVCALLLLASLVSVNPINRAAERAADDLVGSTTTTYIVLRVINASLSLVEAAQVQGTLAVVSAGISPLKMVEPVDDTVERMATALFLVAAFSVLLSIAFNPLAGLGWAALLAYFGLRVFMDSKGDDRSEQPLAEVGWSRLPSYLLRTGLTLGLVLPLAFVVSVHLADLLTNSAWEEHRRVLDEVSSELEQSTSVDGAFSDPAQASSERKVADSGHVPTDATQDRGFFSRIGDLFGEGRDAVVGATQGVTDVARTATSAVGRYFVAAGIVMSRADDLLRSVATILAVLVFKVLVLPVVLAIVILGLVRSSGIAGGLRRIPRRPVS